MAGRWEAECVNLLPTPNPGLVDGHGNPMSTFNKNLTWGIDVATCQRYCNSTIIPLDFRFDSFSNAFTNFLLPWLGLIAQLPYETGDPLENFISACLALGSPALVGYSLAVTILNRLWVRRRFNKIYSRAKDGNVRKRYPHLSDRVRHVEYLLQEAQQVPMRASQEDGWLSSLVVSGRNQGWWERMERNLRKTRRGVTFSFIAQISTAIIAWILTIIASFVGALGEVSTSLQVSGGALWLWMIPILIGWILVGTQSKANSIDDSMESEGSHRSLEPPINNGVYTEELSQLGVLSKSGLTPQPHRVQTIQGAFQAPPKSHLKLPTVFLMDIAGDEGQAGPVYNYARVFTWWQFAHTIEEALAHTVENVTRGRGCRKRAVTAGPPLPPGEQHELWDDKATMEENLDGDCRETASYCGLETSPILAYPSFAEIPSEVKKRILIAVMMAIWIQWGTTGPSIMMAYLTPTVGLGCRSGSYLLYGTLGTVVCLCMVSSMMLSHAAMLRYQEEHKSHPSIDLRKNAGSPPNQYKRTFVHSLICAAAVTTRFVGKLLAFANTLWLIVSSLLEMVGGFNNCWCKADWIGLRERGWVVLFKTADDLAQAATLPLASGVATSIIVCSVAIAFFYFCCANNEDD